jgi:hypothetical protein
MGGGAAQGSTSSQGRGPWTYATLRNIKQPKGLCGGEDDRYAPVPNFRACRAAGVRGGRQRPRDAQCRAEQTHVRVCGAPGVANRAMLSSGAAEPHPSGFGIKIVRGRRLFSARSALCKSRLIPPSHWTGSLRPSARSTASPTLSGGRAHVGMMDVAGALDHGAPVCERGDRFRGRVRPLPWPKRLRGTLSADRPMRNREGQGEATNGAGSRLPAQRHASAWWATFQATDGRTTSTAAASGNFVCLQHIGVDP